MMDCEVSAIDQCIVCFHVDPISESSVHLSHKLASRLKYITPLPNVDTNESIVYPDTSTDDDSNQAERETKYQIVDALRNLDNQSEQPPKCILPQLQRLFLLIHVFEHRLDHPATDKMMLLVQCPSDWFAICSTCRAVVDLAMFHVQSLQKSLDSVSQHSHKESLDARVNELQQKFVDSYLEYVPADCWEFPDEDQAAGRIDVKSMNFLLTEAEAVLEFRQFIHTTAFYRLSQKFDPTPNSWWIPPDYSSFSYNPIPDSEYSEDCQNVLADSSTLDSELESVCSTDSSDEETFQNNYYVQDAEEDNPWYQYDHTYILLPSRIESNKSACSMEDSDSCKEISDDLEDDSSSSEEDAVTSTVSFE